MSISLYFTFPIYSFYSSTLYSFLPSIDTFHLLHSIVHLIVYSPIWYSTYSSPNLYCSDWLIDYMMYLKYFPSTTVNSTLYSLVFLFTMLSLSILPLSIDSLLIYLHIVLLLHSLSLLDIYSSHSSISTLYICIPVLSYHSIYSYLIIYSSYSYLSI